MPAVIPFIPAIVGAAATVYSANQAKKGAASQANAANRALDASTLPRRTQYGSRVDPGAGISRIDPSIRALREQSIGNVPQYQNLIRGQTQDTLGSLGQVQSQLGGLYGQYSDQAFVDPTKQRIAAARGQVVNNLSQRGLGGSSFYTQGLGNFETAAAPALLQAQQAALSGRQGLLGDIANTAVQQQGTASAGVAQLQNLDNLYASVAGQNLQQELSALGLSQADIAGILGAANQLGQAGALRADITGKSLDAFGQIAGGLGSSGAFGSGGQSGSLNTVY